MNWHYNGKEYTEKHDDTLYGFVYCVYFEDDVGNVYHYYGKKKWFSKIKKNYSQKKIDEMADKRRRKYEYVIKDNNWQDYTGSCKDTKDYIPIHKEILLFARTQRELTYLEAKVLFQVGALEDEKCLNGNILSRFYRDNLV